MWACLLGAPQQAGGVRGLWQPGREEDSQQLPQAQRAAPWFLGLGSGKAEGRKVEAQGCRPIPASQALRASAHRERGEAPRLCARKPLPPGARAAGARRRPPASVRVRLPAAAGGPRGRRRQGRRESRASARRFHTPGRPPGALPATAPGLAPGRDGALHRARCAGVRWARAPGMRGGAPPSEAGEHHWPWRGTAKSAWDGLGGTVFLQ